MTTKNTVDMVLATEFQLCIENESALYPQRQAIEKNIAKRMAKGTYDATKAPKLWLYWVTEGARWYAREHACKADKTTREHVAHELARAFEVECDVARAFEVECDVARKHSQDWYMEAVS